MIAVAGLAALTLGAWAVLRRATRPLPAPAAIEYTDHRGRAFGTLDAEQLARVLRGQR